MISKSANQAYIQYKQKGGTLSFFQFLESYRADCESQAAKLNADGSKDDGAGSVVLINQTLNDSVQSAVKKITDSQGLKTTTSGKTIFGINKTVVIVGGLALACSIAFLIIKTKK